MNETLLARLAGRALGLLTGRLRSDPRGRLDAWPGVAADERRLVAAGLIQARLRLNPTGTLCFRVEPKERVS